jgi:hypothetical protein
MLVDRMNRIIMDDGFKKSIADFLKTPSAFGRKRRLA